MACTCVSCMLGDSKKNLELSPTDGESFYRYRAPRFINEYAMGPYPSTSMAVASVLDSKENYLDPHSHMHLHHTLVYPQTFHYYHPGWYSSSPTTSANVPQWQMNHAFVSGTYHPTPRPVLMASATRSNGVTTNLDGNLDSSSKSMYLSGTAGPEEYSVNTFRHQSPMIVSTRNTTRMVDDIYYVQKAQERIKAQQPLRYPRLEDLEYARWEQQSGFQAPIDRQQEENNSFPLPPSPSMLVSDLDMFTPQSSSQKKR
ncbi:hypothetical protein BT96DRAFT_1017357 [Gymnopus androsaceus JB14]|uniref:Uncharacterized protein n=1 Tax=Gymnopus androsaceus JB14 TaxID=1447944 RepID=A0A6A4HY65_9AGAR|nr:hypothetical protein BT96DRAFT_1017357 [Gymnopus androsaceus JB14]